MKYLGYMNALRECYKNWLEVGIGVGLCKAKLRDWGSEVKLKLRDGKTVYGTYGSAFFYAFMCSKNGVARDYVRRKVNCDLTPIVEGEKIKIVHSSYSEKSFSINTFYRSDDGKNRLVLPDVTALCDYEKLHVVGSVVIDIGAYIGDTALLFSTLGAKKIVALEPIPKTYELAVKNIEENNMHNIVLLNAGYGKDGFMFIKDKVVSSGNDLDTDPGGVKVDIMSLPTILDTFVGGSEEKIVLKMDCEGCEYNLLDEPTSILKKFSEIFIEYHYGYKSLVMKLKKTGFKVEYTEPEYRFNRNAKNPHMLVGTIYAYHA